MHHFRLTASHLYCLFLLAAFTIWASPIAAAPNLQQTDLELSRLQIELWPDFDERSVLVLLTGEFPVETSLPITFFWPLPADSRVNVAARIDSNDLMIDDIDYEIGAGGVTITNPDARFRLEYYLPYETNGSDRSFDFTLPAGLAASVLEVTVQQPAAATTISVNPPHEMTQDRGDTLNYLLLPIRSVAANQSVTVSVDYSVSDDLLTAELFNTPPVVTPQPEPSRFDDLNWPLLAAGVAGLLLSFYFIGSGLQEWRQQGSGKRRKNSKPRPRRAQSARKNSPRRPRATPTPKPATGQVNFCHNCGTPIENDDRFCRNCGTAVRGRTE